VPSPRLCRDSVADKRVPSPDFYNPRLIVGAIIEHDNGILLCRRGIQPQRGLWTVPAGFLELGESTAAGAARETLEEAAAAVEVIAPFVHYDIVGIGQSYLLFRARLAPPHSFSAVAPETLEARLFALDELPWDEMAFSSVSLALQRYLADRQRGEFGFHSGSIVKRAGAGANEPGSFSLVQTFEVPGPLADPGVRS
jgi:ADP-ribose/FAD diphosphatase